jgi:tRNA(Ile)-lysidine synthase
LARRLVRKAFECARGDLRLIEFSHVEQVLRLAESCEGHGRFQAPGLDVFRSFEWIRVVPPGYDSLEKRDYRVAVAVPGRYPVPDTGWAIELDTAVSGQAPALESGYNGRESDLDWGRISGMLELRNWRPGDQYRPVGHTSHAKIKLLFQDARIPLWQRRKWPIIVSGEAILWAARFGAAAEFAATPHSRVILKVRELGDFTQKS